MSRKRKTFEVDTLRQMVNSRLEQSTCSPNERLAMASVLEQVLMATGNYRGYNLLRSEYLPAEEQTDGKVIRDDADNSRRRYH